MKKLQLLMTFLILCILIVGCTGGKTDGQSTEVGKVIYSLDLTDSRYMKFELVNYTSNNIELIFPNTHTFDFMLSKDGNVVFDFFKDDPNIANFDWETHQILKANGDIKNVEQGYNIGYESLTKKLNDGIYSFEFYSTSEILNDVPHLKGQLEIKDGNVNVNNIVWKDKLN